MNKKGFYFSLDAFIALLIILGIVVFIRIPVGEVSYKTYVQQDLLGVLSKVQVGEIDNDYVQQLIVGGSITNLNNSIIEQIGEFYAKSDPLYVSFTENILDDLDLDENIGIYFDGTLVASSGDVNFSDSEDVVTARQLISGIQSGSSVTGYSSRAYLSLADKVDYFYFGGYVGDGNIEVRTNGVVISSEIEAVFSGNFDIFINDNFIGSYNPPLDTPYQIDLTPFAGSFLSGENVVEFRSEDNLYIAGGYIKFVYDTSETLRTNGKKYFPGIDGIINVYDSFYVPGDITGLSVSLHYDSVYDIFLDIGNTRVYSGNSEGGVTTVSIDESTLYSLLDYDALSKNTIPVRLGLEDVDYIVSSISGADVFSVTDLSGSMNENVNFEGYSKMIDLAKAANRIFVSTLLEHAFIRVGLVGFDTDVDVLDYHALSTDVVSLNNTINTWDVGAGNCLCCGINYAANALNTESTGNKYTSMVVISDGKPNTKCAQQGTGCADMVAYHAACDAYNDYGIVIDVIGYGDNADEILLQDIASCGSGNYYYSTVEDLIDTYQQIAIDIINASYVEQTVVGEGISTKLYSDSYIQYDFNKEVPFGTVITAETPVFGNNISVGSFNLPSDATPYEVKVLSYSGSRWTDFGQIYDNSSLTWNMFYNLSVYGNDYTKLGDPYVVNVPIEMVNVGENNITISSGLVPGNSSGGSVYNKIIYSVLKNISSYSNIVASADGCLWNIEFEDLTTTTLEIPQNYSGLDVCYYNSSSIIYNSNDALESSVHDLFVDLDLDLDGRIETKFSENDLTINYIEIDGIPFTWETEVQVRAWR